MGMEIPGIIKTGNRSIPKKGTYRAPGRSKPPEQVTLNHQEINESAEILRKTYSLFNKKLKFHINKEINRVIVKVIDGTTDKIIKEIPPEEIQRLVARIKETIGILFDEKI